MIVVECLSVKVAVVKRNINHFNAKLNVTKLHGVTRAVVPLVSPFAPLLAHDLEAFALIIDLIGIMPTAKFLGPEEHEITSGDDAAGVAKSGARSVTTRSVRRLVLDPVAKY